MILVEDWKFHICLFLDKNNPRINIMPDDHLVKKQVLLHYQKIRISYSRHTVFFLGQKII